MRGRIFAFVALAIILMAGVAVVQQGYRDSARATGAENRIVNESFTVNEGSRVGLAESNRSDVVYTDDPTLYDDGQVVEQPGNYSWQAGNGTLVIDSNSVWTDGETGNITYAVYEPTNEQQMVRDIGQAPLNLGGSLVRIAGLIAFLAAFAIFAGYA